MCLLGLGLTLAASGCTHLPWNPYRGWRAWSGHNVLLYTDTLYEHELALEYLDASFMLLQHTFFRQFPVPPMQAIYLQPGNDTPLRTETGVKKFGAVLAGVPPELAGNQHLLMTVGRLDHIRPYAHLVTHHFIESAIPGAPLWFHEGFAIYASVFQSHERRPDVICFGLLQPASRWSITEKVDEVMRTTWAEYNESAAPWFQDTAWGLVDYLLHGEGGSLRPGFRPLMEAFRRGLRGKDALQAAYPQLPLDQLDDRLRDHVRTLRQPSDLCPLAVALDRPVLAGGARTRTDIPEAQMRKMFQVLEHLPHPRGYADFFPAPLSR